MNRTQIPGWWNPVMQFVLGAALLAGMTAVFFQFGFHLAIVAPAYLVLIVGVSLLGGVIAALGVTILATGVLAYYFAEPIFSFTVASAEEAIALLAFILATLVIVTIVHRIKASEAQLRARAHLLDLTHDTIFVRDMRNTITFWNRGAEDRYGWSSEQAIGQVTHQILRTQFPAPLEMINAQLMAIGRWEGELVHSRRDGTKVVVASRWALQRDQSGQPIAILETNNDITARKQVEEQLVKTQIELAHINRVTTIGQLAASIAHEVNQPISAAITNANAALRFLSAQPPDLGEVREALTEIATDGRRAADVIGRIRALIRKVPPRYETLDINQAILEVLALTRTQMDSNGVTLHTQLADGLPQVAADRVRIQQVMLNLVVNAIEAMSGLSGTARRLTVSTAEGGAGGVHITVQDNGPGLTPESLDQLFSAFYTTKPSGMGMGLAICRSIVEAHGGQLWASTDAPPGAVFRFTLPPRPSLSESA